MQQTKLDRHLREKYAYVTHIFSNTKPREIPIGVEFEELSREKGSPYRYRFSSKKYEFIQALARNLESENITYTSRVTDRKVWYRGLINNPKKSFSYRLFWVGILVSMICFAFTPAPKMIVAYIQAEDDVEENKQSYIARVKEAAEKLNFFSRFDK